MRRSRGMITFGMPLIEAARLCDRCVGAQILAKGVVAQLAAGRGHSFESLGALELKGLPEPMDAVQVVPGPENARAPLRKLPPRYQRAVRDALRGEEIPAGLREQVKRYFDAPAPSSSGAAPPEASPTAPEASP